MSHTVNRKWLRDTTCGSNLAWVRTLKGQAPPVFVYELTNSDFVEPARRHLGPDWQQLQLGDLLSADAAAEVAFCHPGAAHGDQVVLDVTGTGIGAFVTKEVNGGSQHQPPVLVASLVEPVGCFQVLQSLATFGSERGHVSRTNEGIRVTQAGHPRNRPEVFDLSGPDALALKEWLIVQQARAGFDDDRDLDSVARGAHGVSHRDLEQIRKVIREAGFGDTTQAWLARLSELITEVHARGRISESE